MSELEQEPTRYSEGAPGVPEGHGERPPTRRSKLFQDTVTFVVLAAAIVGISLAVRPFLDREPESTAGSLAEAGEVGVGDCFNGSEAVADGSPIDSLELVSCDSPHQYEMFAVVTHPADSAAAYPANEELSVFGETGCMGQFEGFVGTSWFEAGYDITFIFPARDAWEAGDRTLQCALVRMDGQMSTKSAKSAGRIVPDDHTSVFLLDEGDCVVFTAWVAFVTRVPCAEPHDGEIYAVSTSPAEPGASYSSFEEHVVYADRFCERAFFNRVEASDADGVTAGPLMFPSTGTWDLGYRSYICVLGSVDGARLSGSRLSARSRFDGLLEERFDDSQVEYETFGSIEGLMLGGSAHQSNEFLALTEFAEHRSRGVPFEDERAQRGAVWFGEKVPVATGFQTAFVFQIQHYSWFTVGDGLSFVIHNDDPSGVGEGLGYNRIPNSIAVEFDTVTESWLEDPPNRVSEAPDLLGNHVAVHTLGREPNDLHNDAAIGLAHLDSIRISDRAAHLVLITYVPGDLSIYVDDLDEPVLTVDIDLAETLALDGTAAYVGFGASSGPHSYRGATTYTISGHKILGWEFSSQ